MNKAFSSGAQVPNMNNRPNVQSRIMAAERPRHAGSTIRRLLSLYMANAGTLVLAVFFVLCAAALSLLSPYLLGLAVDCFAVETGTVAADTLYGILIPLVGAYGCTALCNVAQGYLIAGVSQRLVKRMRGELFEKLQQLPLGFFDTHAHGDVMSRMTNDTDNISNIIAQATTQLMTACVVIVGTVFMMLWLSLPLTLAAFAILPLLYLLTRVVTRHTRGYILRQQAALGQLNALTEETVQGLKMVKAFNREESQFAVFEEKNGEFLHAAMRSQIWAGFLMPLTNVLNNIGFALIACVGGVLAVQGHASIGMITSFTTYSRQMARPLGDIAGMVNNLQTALAGAERVFEIIDEEPQARDTPDAQEAAHFHGEVRFEHVTFGYDPAQPVLRDVSFTVPQGSSVALVGPTGAGKTTLVNLLTRFYEPQKGRILIDGSPITRYTRASLRQLFSVVLQDTCLFTGTVADNIRYASPEATDEMVRRAAKTANAHEFISRLPQGYDTPVSGSSDILSEGQRQLIAIARAVLCDAAVLILDEATSSVDTRTEFHIQDAMKRLQRGRTTFFIAHRLSTIRDADRIMVVADGCIREQGAHDELMAQKGLYYTMYQSQCVQD